MDFPFKIRLSKYAIHKATDVLLWRDYNSTSRWQSLLGFGGYSLFIALFCVAISGGTPSKFSHPGFVLYTALVVIAIQWPYLWRWHKHDLRKHGYVRRTSR